MSNPITTKNLSVLGATYFQNLAATSNLFLAFGRTTAWANDSAPPIANTNIAGTYEVWGQLIGGKKLTANDVRLAIPRNTWAANTTYEQYDDLSTSLYANSNFYVVNSAFNVYKCISNANGAISTSEPTYLSTTNISSTADGYKWKFLYSLTSDEQSRFMTSQYIPVKTLSVNDGSLQWGVQSSAIPGAINNILLTSGGSGYSNVANLVISITGDGSGAMAFATINNISNSVNSISLSTYGLGYTQATATISGGGGSGATARPIISPPGGHGSDPVAELGAFTAILNPNIINSEGGVLSTNNDYRQITLIQNPNIYAKTQPLSNSAFSQSTDAYLSNYGVDYAEDEVVYQGAGLSTSTFSGRVLQWDSANLVIRLINTTGTISSDVLIGVNTAASRFVTGIKKFPDANPNSGKLLYIENISPISRSPVQTESFKLIIPYTRS